MTDSGFAIVRNLLVIIVVSASLALFRKYVPANRSKLLAGKLDLDQLDEQFMPLRWKVIGAMIAVGIVFLLGSWFALSRLNLFFATFGGPADYLLLPQTAIWWFFPGFGAVALCWELTLQIWALFGDRARVNLFSDWTNQSTKFWGACSYAGMDSRKILRWMALLIALPMGIFTALALNMHASVGPTSIRDCGYNFTPCAVFPLADARRVTAIEGFQKKDGKLSPRAGLVIDFKDGRRWSSANWGNFEKTVDPALASGLTRETNLPIESATTEEEIPPLGDHSLPAQK
jgi:hypothetical protein